MSRWWTVEQVSKASGVAREVAQARSWPGPRWLTSEFVAASVLVLLRFVMLPRAVMLAAVIGLSGMLIGAESGVWAAELTADSLAFESDIQPLLARHGCNSGPCHGKSRGQNGFALSLLGFDSDFDYTALVREGRGRRIFPAAPENSLLLLKATGQLPHGGGKRLEPDSPHYALLRDWIRAGAPRSAADAPQLKNVVVEPATCSLEPQQRKQLQVWAEYSDGSRRNVTDMAAYQSNDQTIAAIVADEDGQIQAGPVPGEAAIMVRYLNRIAVCEVTIPLPGELSEEAYAALPRYNAVDEIVWSKLKQLRMLPSGLAGESTFHRRAYLRILGRLPTPAETTAYLDSTDPNKRTVLIDQLVERPEYADFWANKWADLLRPNPYRVGMKAVWNLDAWLRQAFRENWPYDRFVRELLTAKGSTWRNGATVIFRDRPEAIEMGAATSQLFLGVRLECAKCHHHPFEVWSQDDFFGFAAFFARVGHKGAGLSPPISGGEEIIYARADGELRHGRTGAPVQPKTLHGEALQLSPDDDPREKLVEWMVDPANPYFAQVMVSRVWADLMGRGLLEPVDDIRATNPAANQKLLAYLATDFREHNYDIKHLIKTIAKSAVFSLSSGPEARNIADSKNFSRYYRQRMRAEVLLDAVNDVLGTTEEFEAMPPDSRAMQLWTYRASSFFLDTFGRPDPNQDPPCERTSDSTTPQILHLMNSPDFERKLKRDDARPAQLAASSLTNEELVSEIYLRIYSRRPSDTERAAAVSLLPAQDRRAAVEDLFWVLINTPEFSFID